MKNLSRRDFLKGVAAGGATLAVAGVLGGCSSSSSDASTTETTEEESTEETAEEVAEEAVEETAEAIYTPGTYTATATGIGEIVVTMTFDETSITDVELDLSNETDSIGQAAGDELAAAILEAQSAEIDAVSGATVTSNAVMEAAANCIAQAKGEEIAETEEEETGERVWGYSGPGDWLGTAPEITDIAEEVDVDVVVVGAGHAGVQAALAAAEAGAVVAVVEKQTEDTFAWYGEDVGVFNSQLQIDAGFGPYDLGEVTNEFITRGGGRAFPEIVRLYVANSGETLDHMLEVAREMGVDERCYTYDNTPDGYLIIQCNMDYDKIAAGNDIYDCIRYDYPITTGTKTWASTAQFMGEYNDEPIDGVAANSVLPVIQQACVDKAIELGATYYYGTPAQVLVQNDDGDVIGVIAQKEDGSYIKFNTTKGVVMCGGDYAGNADMCWALLNEYMERNERSGGAKADFYSFMGGRDGDSVKMMCWAGGLVEPAPRGTMILGGGPSGPWGTNSMLWLNSEGERFVNEGNISCVQTAVSRQPAGVIALVTDAKWMKSVCACGLEHSGPNAGRPQYYQDMLDDFENIESGPDGGQVKNCTIAERGYSTVIKADTLEELAGYLGYEGDAVDTFLASIEHYNELCYAGADTDFGKDASVMIPVDEAPYYGVTSSQSDSPTPSMVTMSGMMTDKRLNVLDKDRNPIKGLYCAGNSLGGRYGTGYSTPCAGNSIGMAVTHGRLAGQFVCEEE